MTTSEQITSLSDAGHPPAEIARRLRLSLSRVYAVLQVERPDRPRAPRRRTSDLPRKVRGLLARGIAPSRVAFLLGITRQYVHRIAAADKSTSLRG